MLGLEPDSVRVRWAEGAGSFGGSPGRFEVGTAAAIISQIVGKPIRVELSRSDEHGWDNYAMPQLMDVRGGVDADAKITALDYTITELPFPVTTYTMEQLVGRPYGEPQRWDPSTDVTGSQYAFAVEQAIDELAYLANMDPVEFRRRNIQTENTHPQANFLWLGMYDYSHVASNRQRWLAVLDAVAEAAQWQPRVAASFLSNDTIVHERGFALAGTGSASAASPASPSTTAGSEARAEPVVAGLKGTAICAARRGVASPLLPRSLPSSIAGMGTVG